MAILGLFSKTFCKFDDNLQSNVILAHNSSIILPVVQQLDRLGDSNYFLGRVAMIFLSEVAGKFHKSIRSLLSIYDSWKTTSLPHNGYQRVHKIIMNVAFYDKFNDVTKHGCCDKFLHWPRNFHRWNDVCLFVSLNVSLVMLNNFINILKRFRKTQVEALRKSMKW